MILFFALVLCAWGFRAETDKTEAGLSGMAANFGWECRGQRPGSAGAGPYLLRWYWFAAQADVRCAVFRGEATGTQSLAWPGLTEARRKQQHNSSSELKREVR